MNCELVRFVNFSKSDVVVLDDGATDRYSSILSPLLEMIQHKLKGNYLYGEEFLMKYLQKHRNFLPSEDMVDLSRHMSTCVAHIYVIVIAMFLSIVVAIPLVCCVSVCNRKTANPKKHRYWFCCTGFMMFVTVQFIAIGAVSSWYVGLETQRALDKLPAFTRNVIQNFDKGIERFENESRILTYNMTGVLDAISSKIDALPDDVLDIIDGRIQSDYEYSIQKFNECLEIIGDVYDNLGNKKQVGELQRGVLNETNFKTYVTIRTSRSGQFLKKETGPDQNYTPQLYKNLNSIMHLLPNFNKTIHFKHDFLKDVRNSMTEQHKSIPTNLDNTRHLLELVSKNVTDAWRKSFPDGIRRAVLNAASQTDSVLKQTSLSSGDDASIYSKLTTWLFLLPALYALLILWLLVIGLSGTCKNLQNISNGNGNRNRLTILCYKAATNISVSFLWLILLLAAMVYCIHIPATVICGVVKRDKFISRYVDKNVWDNNTWLSYKFKRVLPMLNDNLKFGHLLDRCRRNNSIFLGLDLKEYIKNRTDPSKITFNASKTKRRLAKIFSHANLPNISDFDDVLRHATLINDTLTLGITPKMYEDVGSFPNDSGNMARSNSDTRILTETKFLIEKFEVKLEELKRLEWRLNASIRTRTQREVYRYLEETSHGLACLAKKSMEHTESGLLGRTGNCYILSYIYDRTVWTACDYCLELLNITWLALSLIGFSVIIASILCYRITSYIRGAHKLYLQDKLALDINRYSSGQAKLNNDVNQVN